MANNIPLVLYADDDNDDVLLVHELFAAQPGRAELVSVQNGIEAILFLQDCSLQRLPALIILDVNMPSLDGRETLMRLRNLPGLQSTPVVLLTTSSFDLHPLFAKQYGARFMTKPLRDYQLTALLEMVPPATAPHLL
jgi:CheY-like chemotaxis protein